MGLEILTILAILSSPVIALQIQRRLDQRRDKTSHKLWIFRTLMATRDAPVSTSHVEALNSIDLAFSPKDKSDKKVLTVWKEYNDHLNTPPANVNGAALKTERSQWSIQTRRLFIDLLFIMSTVLEYNFDRVQLKKGSYTPVSHGNVENEMRIIREGIVDIMEGRSAIPIYPLQPRNAVSDSDTKPGETAPSAD